jgi:hypothetical protein
MKVCPWLRDGERVFDTGGMCSEGAGARLEELAALAERVRPTVLAGEQVLPVLGALDGLLPGGLRRGSSLAVGVGRAGRPGGATSLALAVAAGPSAAGSWVAAVGVPSLGLAAAAGYGVDLDRLVLVADPPPERFGQVVALLVDAFDVVLVRPPPGLGAVRAADARRLAARARERGSVLVRLDGGGGVQGGAWPEAADVTLTVTVTTWEGLGDGHGHLRARRAVVEAGGRRGAARPRRAELWLPGPDGAVAVAPPLAEVRPFRPTASSPPRTGGSYLRHDPDSCRQL